MQWYYAVNKDRKGPVDQAEFDRLVASGVVTNDTLVWHQGMTEWQAYATVIGTPGADADSAICAVSGKRYPKREMIQYEGQWISAEHRDEFFQRQREGVTIPGRMEYARFLARFCAKFLDGIIVGLIGMVANFVLAAVLLGSWNYFVAQKAAAGTSAAVFFMLVSNAVGIGIGVSYSVFFVRKFSATPGKMALGLKLVRADGSPLSVGRIVGRHFAEWVSGIILLIGYIMAGFDEQGRALHDRICDTRVIKSK